MIKNNLETMMFIRKMTIKELSEKSGINTNTLYAWKNGKATRIDLMTLEKLCNTLNCGISDLLIKTNE